MHMLLATERLILREFEENDWRTILAYQSDPLYLRYNPWNYRTETDVRQFVQTFMNWRHEKPRRKFQLAITLKSSGVLIGNGGIRMKAAYAKDADIGYELDSNYWGHGYATETARAFVDFGFKELRLHRIWAQCISENVASARVLEKVGMQLEGHFRENEWLKNRWWDTLQYAILEREWNQQYY
jgi:ribosomal-protein-alanine N-acetyltransferase